MKRNHSVKHHRREAVDPVLSCQGGRMMSSDPGHVIPTSEEDVRRHAYAKYEQRGQEGGKALDDWVKAEAEVNQYLGEDWRVDRSGTRRP
jgi:hypothetical protein